MPQRTLHVTQGRLFFIGEKGETVDKGNCACALVALPQGGSASPKYSLVWYNKHRETLAVLRLPQDGGHHAKKPSCLCIEPSGCFAFEDDVGGRWNFSLPSQESIVVLLAHVSLALRVLASAGARMGTPFVADFTPSTVDPPLRLQHEARVRFSSYAVRLTEPGPMEALGPLRESNFGDQKPPYVFAPARSWLDLGPSHHGFEAAVVGMTEGSYRGVVLPARLGQYPRVDEADEGGGSVVLVVQLERAVELEPARPDIPTVFAGSDDFGVGGPAPHGPYPDGQRQSFLIDTARAGGGGTAAAIVPVAESGPGIPAEHVALLQGVGVGIRKATTAARDVKDILAVVAQDWEHALRGAEKPSTLTHSSLQDHIQQLVLQHERNVAGLEQRDEVIRSLDAGNRELQKRVDAAALASQQLLDKSKSVASAGMDIRLERSRALMKLQEQIHAATHERDDAQRHLVIVKRLQAASEEELQQLRGRTDIHRVQSTGMLSELDASQAAVSEARGRRKGLEARVSSLTESVRSAQAQLRAKASEVEATRAAADRARDHQVQLMEDERNSRALDAQQLRTDIVAELAKRETTFRSERARAAEDGFRRGREEGKEQGRRDAAAGVAAQQNELQLDLQRAKGLMESRREELRGHIEAAMASRRKLVAATKESREALEEAVRVRLRLQVRHDRLTREAATAKDTTLERLRGVTRHITQPATAEQLASVLTTLHQHSRVDRDLAESASGRTGVAAEAMGARPRATTTDIDFTFDRRNWSAARSAAIQRRLGYMEAEALRLFEKGLSYYYHEWLRPLQAAHDDCAAAVKAVWIDAHGAPHYALCQQERAGRHAVEEERDRFLAALTGARARQRAAREEVLQQAKDGAASLFASYVDGLGRLRDLLALHRKALDELARAESEERQGIAAVAMRGLREMPSLLQDAILGERLMAQRFLAEEEEAGRAALLTEELQEAAVLRFNEGQGRVEARHDTLLGRQRQEVRDEESAARQQLEAEEAALLQQLYSQHIAVVSAIYRQSQELKRLLEGEQRRMEAARAEERGALVVEEEYHRYESVEEAELRERAELAEAEAAQRPPPPPPVAATAPVHGDDAGGEVAPHGSKAPPSPPPPPPLTPSGGSDDGAGPHAPAARPQDPPPPPPPTTTTTTMTMWDGPPDLPPPTPPKTPTSESRGPTGGGEPSPFAVAWAGTDHVRRTPPPTRSANAAADTKTKPSQLPEIRPRPESRFEDSEDDDDSSSGNGGAAAAPKPPPQPLRKRKPSALATKQRLFDGSSGSDDS